MKPCNGCGATDFIDKFKFFQCSYCGLKNYDEAIKLRKGLYGPSNFGSGYSQIMTCSYATSLVTGINYYKEHY